MRKIIAIVMVMAMAFAMASCSEAEIDSDVKHTEESSVEKGDVSKSMESEEELSELVIGEVEADIADLNKDFEKLTAEVDTYEKFVKNVDRVEAFYGQIYDESVNLGIRLREYSAACAEAIISSNESYEDKYDEFDMLYECIYEDAGDAVYDGIYDGVLEDMFDTYYDGILEDGYDVAPYEEWFDTSSDEYDRWLDTSSDVYDEWLDIRSDIYDFMLDVRGEIFDGDMEKATEYIEEFKAETEALKESAAGE